MTTTVLDAIRLPVATEMIGPPAAILPLAEEEITTPGEAHPFVHCVNPHLADLLGRLWLDKRFVRGEGCELIDDEGRRYLDCIAAYGALPFGFNPPEIWQSLREVQRSGEPSFVQPSILDAAGELAERLLAMAPSNLRYVTFANSGAEAIEAAIKLCRIATGRMGILSTDNSFHGKTLGSSVGHRQSALSGRLRRSRRRFPHHPVWRRRGAASRAGSPSRPLCRLRGRADSGRRRHRRTACRAI